MAGLSVAIRPIGLLTARPRRRNRRHAALAIVRYLSKITENGPSRRPSRFASAAGVETPRAPGAAARLRHGDPDRGHVRRHAAGRRRIALPGAPPPRGDGLDQGALANE